MVVIPTSGVISRKNMCAFGVESALPVCALAVSPDWAVGRESCADRPTTKGERPRTAKTIRTIVYFLPTRCTGFRRLVVLLPKASPTVFRFFGYMGLRCVRVTSARFARPQFWFKQFIAPVRTPGLWRGRRFGIGKTTISMCEQSRLPALLATACPQSDLHPTEASKLRPRLYLARQANQRSPEHPRWRDSVRCEACPHASFA